jgi:hypothetical protein
MGSAASAFALREVGNGRPAKYSPKERTAARTIIVSKKYLFSVNPG